MKARVYICPRCNNEYHFGISDNDVGNCLNCGGKLKFWKVIDEDIEPDDNVDEVITEEPADEADKCRISEPVNANQPDNKEEYLEKICKDVKDIKQSVMFFELVLVIWMLFSSCSK